jgi:alpha-D-ribose 1-methylphosphonate 5-triphosphate diphosphatase
VIAVRGRRLLVEGLERRGGWVLFDRGRFVGVSPSAPLRATPVDLGDVDLLPGLVDLHSDSLELKARPRPGVELPLAGALLELDTELAAWGITTSCLCVRLEDDLGRYGSLVRARDTVATLERMGEHLRVDHRLHLRVDVTGDGLDTAHALADSQALALLSYMVHLPGIGRFPDEASWRSFYRAVETVEAVGGSVEVRLERRRARLPGMSAARAAVAQISRAQGVALASHDDPSEAAVLEAHRLGATISEFPLTLAAAATARSLGIDVALGAPNVRRRGSHNAHLSAREALAAGCLTVLTSDYHPPSLLAAAYALADEGLASWAGALALVTSRPAQAAGLADRGRIEQGRRADLVAVGRRAGLPSVVRTWVAGREVLSA